MDISQPAISSSAAKQRSYDGRILLGYAVLCVLAFAALYYCSDGPSFSGADLALAVALP
jgi:hypothetical protein